MQLKSLSQKTRNEFWEALNDICSDSMRTVPSESCNQKCLCGQGPLEIILTFFWKQNLRWSRVLSSRMFSFLHCLTEVKCTPVSGTVCLRWTVLLEEKKKLKCDSLNDCCGNNVKHWKRLIRRNNSLHYVYNNYFKCDCVEVLQSVIEPLNGLGGKGP